MLATLPSTPVSVLATASEMLNTEINEFAAQTNLTQVASYFDMVDNVVRLVTATRSTKSARTHVAHQPHPFRTEVGQS